MKWGLIGASTIAAQWMIPAIRETGGEIVGVMSSNPTRGADYAAEHGIANSTADLDALLAMNIDAVYISTVNDLHKPQTLAAAAAGKHVLSEKPLATSMADAADMIHACRNAGVVMATNHHLRHAATHKAMAERVQAGALGRPLAARVFHAVYLPEHLQGWRLNDPKAGGGVVLDITVHNADTLAHLLGEYPKTVTARTQNAGMGQGLEDGCMGIWEFPSGLQAYTHEAFTTPFARTGLEVHGDAGSLYADNVMTQQPVGSVKLVTAQGEEALKIEHHNLYVQGISRFVEAIGGAELACDGVAGYRSMAVAMATLESAKTGTTVTVDYGEFNPH